MLTVDSAVLVPLSAAVENTVCRAVNELDGSGKGANDVRLRFLLGATPRDLNWMANSAFANTGFALVRWILTKMRHFAPSEVAFSDGIWDHELQLMPPK